MGFRIETESMRRHTLRDAKRIALLALLEYEIEWSSIHFIQISEHITFRIVAEEGKQFLLRIHSATKPYNEVISELEWMSALKGKGLDLPEPVSNRHGTFLTTPMKGDEQGMYSSLLGWVEGERKEKGELSEEAVRKMGATLAVLHDASSDFSPSAHFHRPVWGVDSFAKDWERFRTHRLHILSDEAAQLYSMAAMKATAQLSNMIRHERNYGMIHADLHIGNFVFRNEDPYPIDFGRCGFGYHLYDIAQSIMGLYPRQRAMFIEGYETVRDLDETPIPELECFFIMAIIEAYSFHAENPTETDGFIEEQPYAQAILRSYLNGTPFLFQPLSY